MSNKKINPQKADVVVSLKTLLSQAKSVSIVDYKGLKVTQVDLLRRNIRKAGGELVVAKNTLFKIAANLTDVDITGTSAFVFSLTDEVAAPKAIADFAKKNQLPTFKFGLLSDKVLSLEEITHLSTLSDKPTLIVKTLGSLKSPLFGLANALNWNISRAVRTLDAVRASKEVHN